MNYALIGLGFISPRHMKAITQTGGFIVSACDIDESKWSVFELVHDKPQLFLDWQEMMESRLFRKKVDYVVVLTPNYLHFPIIRKALSLGKQVICEKPLVFNTDEFNEIKDREDVNVLLQLRHAYNIIREKRFHNRFNSIKMIVNVHRGDWYFNSWKVDESKSGGLLWNIGVHYFDILNREFGPFIDFSVSPMNDKNMSGFMYNGKAKIDWKLSLEAPIERQERRIILNRIHDIDLTNFTYGLSEVKEVFADLHTKAYEAILKGEGVKPKHLVTTNKLLYEMTGKAVQLRDGI